MSSPYRSDSLDSLVSSDDLDQASSLIRFRSFLFLVVFAILLSLGVLCCIFIEVPIKVSGSSVIWSDVGVLQVAAKDPGSIKEISVKVGDRVEKGQVIADLDQSQIEDKLEATQRKLKVLNDFVLDIKNLQTFDQIERAKFKKTTDQLASDAKRLNRNRILRFQQRKGELKKLFDDGLIQFEQYHALIDRVDQADA